MGLKEIVLHVKPASLLIQLKDTNKEWYASNLAKQCNMTYVYATKRLNAFKKYDLVTFEVKGRIKKVKLTEKGLQIATALSDLMLKFEKKEDEKPA